MQKQQQQVLLSSMWVCSPMLQMRNPKWSRQGLLCVMSLPPKHPSWSRLTICPKRFLFTDPKHESSCLLCPQVESAGESASLLEHEAAEAKHDRSVAVDEEESQLGTLSAQTAEAKAMKWVSNLMY